jgi:hypothetical protein
METRTIEQRVAELETANFAQGLVVKVLLAAVLDTEAHAALREHTCKITEALYKESGVTLDHYRLQQVLAEIEALFRPAKPRGPQSNL